MSDTMLPPLILELRARAGQLYTELGTVDKAIAKTAAEGEASGSKLEGAFNKTAAAGKMALLGVVGASAAVGIESIKMASTFQSQMTLLQTAGGEQASNMKVVSDGILNLARSTGTSTDQLAEGMYTIEKAGIRGSEGLQVLKAAAQGAKAENVDLSTATNALTSVMMSYHLKASDAVSVQNQLIAGSGMAKTSMQNYAGALSTVIPVASAAGIGFDQVAGAIATLTQHGTSAEESTQELANTIRNLQAPNQVAQKAMQQLGINVTDLSTNLGQRGLTGTIDLITNAISSKMGPAGTVAVNAFKQSQSASADLNLMMSKMPANLKALSSGLLDGSVDITKYSKSTKAMGGEAGAMGLQFLSLYKSSQGFNDLVKSGQPAAQTMAAYLKNVMGGATGLNTALMLGGENMKYFTTATNDVAKAGQNAGSNISTWAQTSKNFSVQFDRFKETIQTAAIVIGTWLIPKVQEVMGFLADHIGVVEAIAGVIGGLLVGAIMAYIAQLTIAGVRSVINFGKMIYAAARWTVQTAASIAETLALWVMYAAEWIATTSASLVESASIYAIYFTEWLSTQAAAVTEWVATSAAGVAEWVTTQAAGFAESIAAGAGWIAEHVAMAAVAVVQYGLMAAAATAAFIAENAATLGIGIAIAALVAGIIWVATHWHQTWDAIKNAASAAWDFIKGVFDEVLGFAEKWGPLILAAVMPVIGIPLLLYQHWGDVSAFFSQLWSDVTGFFAAAYHTLESVFMAPIKLEIQGVERVWSASLAGVKSAVNDAWTFVRDVMGWIQVLAIGPLLAAAHGLEDGWHAVWNGMGNAVKAVWDFIRPIIDTIKSAVGSVSGAVGKITGGISKGLSVIGLDTGGWTPGAVGQPTPAIIHGGEYMLSNAMLNGTAPIDSSVLAAVMSSPYLANATTVSPNPGTGAFTVAAGVGITAPQPISAAGGSTSVTNGGDTYVFQVSGMVDYNGLFAAVQKAYTQNGGRNSQGLPAYRR